MKYLNQIKQYKRTLPKYSLGGVSSIEGIDPVTGKPYPENIFRNSKTNKEELLNSVKPSIITEYGEDNLEGLDFRSSSDVLTKYGESYKPLTGNPKPSYWNRVNPETKEQLASAGTAVAGMAASSAAAIIDEKNKSFVEDDLGIQHQKTDVAGGVASGAAKGAAISASLGFADFGASAVIGGAVGGIQSKLGNDKVDAAMLDSSRKLYDYKSTAAKNRYVNLKRQGFNTQGNETTMFAEGGEIGWKTEPHIAPKKPVVFTLPPFVKGTGALNDITDEVISTALGFGVIPKAFKLARTAYQIGKPNTINLMKNSPTYTDAFKELVKGFSFAGGGEIPRKPIIVTDPNDPRLRAYNDSNEIRNASLNAYKKYYVKEFQFTAPNKNGDYGNPNRASDFNYNINRLNREQAKADAAIQSWHDTYGKFGGTNAMPFSHERHSESNGGRGGSIFEKEFDAAVNKNPNLKEIQKRILPTNSSLEKEFAADLYKKPVQPVIYQKPVVKPKVENNTSSNRVVNITQEKFDKIKNKIGVSPFVLEKDGVYRNDLGEQYKIVKPVAKPKTVISNPNIQQPIQQNKNVVNTQPIQQPVAIAPQVPPAYTSQKQFYQGRAFMDSTQLRPGWYHPEQITERMKDPNRKFAGGGVVPRSPIKVTDPNDKRLKAFNDSNELYKYSNNYRNVLLKNSISPIKNEIILKDTETLDKIHKNIPYSKTMNDKIKPIAYYDIGVGNNKQYNESALYKKPVQPYELVKKKPTPKPTQDYWNTDKDVLAFRKTFKEKYGEEPSRDPKIAKYDYDKAYKAGVKPVMDSTDGLYHWDSRFKHDDHPNLVVNGTNTKTGKPVEQPKVEVSKPKYTSEKKQYQGSDFTLQTGLRPGLYHPEEIEEVKKQKKGLPVSKIIPKFAKGGNVTPQYEVEKDEVVQGQDTQLEDGTQLASDLTLVGGERHEDGGTQGSGGDRVFSDRLEVSPLLTLLLKASKVNVKKGDTYANVAATLGKKKSTFETAAKSNDPISNKTGKVMTQRIDDLLEMVFQEQETLKQQEEEIMAYGGQTPKYAFGTDLKKAASGYTTPEQGINTAVYLANLKNAGKQKTSIKRQTGEPTYLKRMDSLPFAKAAINKAVSVGYANNRRSSGNVQDRFSRDMSVATLGMDKTNEAVQTQFERDYAVNSANAQIKSGYDSRLAENLNADMLDKVTGENSILANKQTATNAWLAGIMGNYASNRQYEVENSKLAIARMDGARGTAGRSAKKLLKDPNLDPSLRKSLEEAFPEETYAKGGKFKKVKQYC